MKTVGQRAVPLILSLFLYTSRHSDIAGSSRIPIYTRGCDVISDVFILATVPALIRSSKQP